jgi:glutamine synthetase
MRIPVSSQKNRRVEHRVAGADANPYLVVAAVMAGIHHGITNHCDPGPMIAEREDIKYRETLPIRWPLALQAFTAGQILPGYFGKEYHRVFSVCREEEADKFHSEISDRDYAWYLRSV